MTKYIIASGLVVVTISIVLTLAFFSTLPYYHHNWYKPHRWMSQECAKHGIKQSDCGFVTFQVNGPVVAIEQNPNSPPSKGWIIYPVEIARFDICLEHGELRRIQ